MDCDHLSSLPNEITIAIVDSLGPTETWSFARASRALYNLSQPALQRHREQKYSTICLGDDGDQPVDFLDEEFLRDPRIASCVNEMQISSCWEDDDDVDQPDKYPDIAALGPRCPWLSESQQRKWRDALLVPKNQLYHLAILLTLLPNLGSIKLLAMENGYKPILEMVCAIAIENQNPASPVHDKALSALTRISIAHLIPGIEQQFDIYAPFIALPSMRSLHGCVITGHFDPAALPSALFDQNNRLIQQSYIEEIEMTQSSIAACSWAWMLGSIKDLRRFTYEHVGNIEGVWVEYRGQRIVALLQQHAAHSLQQMDLTAWYSGYWGDDWEMFIGDLSDFQLLRVLRVNDTVFQRPDRRFVRLDSVLPASIRVVTLARDKCSSEDRTELFVGLAQGRHRLPELERICLEGEYSLSKDLIDRCKGVGIQIEGSDLQVD
ncbi:MAG: hypothetical protein Q9178_006023 [Gyalolechia marmorata]